MSIQYLRGSKKDVNEGASGQSIKDSNEKQGPSSAFEICYPQDEMDRLPIKKPTGE